MRKLIDSLGRFVGEDFQRTFGVKDRWRSIGQRQMMDDPDLPMEIFTVIQKSYKDIGGHKKISSPKDVTPYKNKAIDVDSDPYTDAVIIARKEPSGMKIVAVGTDGGSEVKAKMLKHIESIMKGNAFIEVSGALGHILLKKGLSPVTDEATVKKTLSGRNIKWVGAHPDGKYPGKDGWYYRNIAGDNFLKIMLGRPKK